jgi:hypothetical protein
MIVTKNPLEKIIVDFGCKPLFVLDNEIVVTLWFVPSHNKSWILVWIFIFLSCRKHQYFILNVDYSLVNFGFWYVLLLFLFLCINYMIFESYSTIRYNFTTIENLVAKYSYVCENIPGVACQLVIDPCQLIYFRYRYTITVK